MELINTLIELERLKRLDRTGWTLRGLPSGTESVAAHSFGVCVASMLLADLLISRGINLNVEKLLRMAILHDWAEARLGDMPRTAKAYFPTGVIKQAEHSALTEIVGEGARSAMYRSLYDDYEQRASLEARLVKVADVIDLLVEAIALERSGAKGLDEFWDVAGQAHLEFEAEVQSVVTEVIEGLLKTRNHIGAAGIE
jgi:putative hydrolase of HD superfamily